MMSPTVEPVPVLEPAVRADLRALRQSSWFTPLLGFVAVFGLWLMFLAGGLWHPHWAVRLAVVPGLTLTSGQLFMLAHDAGHRSFSTSAVVNGVVGRLALVPSMHVFGLWRDHHNVHHRYTNLRDRDFVWTPLSVDEYQALPPWRRRLHRIFRHPSGLGLGLHYSLEIWAPRMLWPRSSHGLGDRGRLMFDSVLLYGALIGLAAAARQLVVTVDPQRVGDVGFWLSAVLLLFVLPMLLCHWLIGFVIYLNHTHPDIVWYQDPEEWARHNVQLEGSTGLRFPLRHFLLPRRIMHHTAHHVDPAVPLGNLDRAQQRLTDRFSARVVSYEWSPVVFRTILSHCKLYDYDNQRWLTYEAAGEPR